MKTRTQAAQEIFTLQSAMEERGYALSTILKKIVRLPNGNWHLIGKGYDYTA